MEDWTQTLSTAPLLTIAAAAIALILVLVIKFKLHAFLTLILVALLTAFATGIPTGMIVDTAVTAFGGTLGSVALLIGLGAMLGKLVEHSGGNMLHQEGIAEKGRIKREEAGARPEGTY